MFPQYSNKIANNPNVAFWELPGNRPVTVTEDVNGSLFNLFAGVDTDLVVGWSANLWEGAPTSSIFYTFSENPHETKEISGSAFCGHLLFTVI